MRSEDRLRLGDLTALIGETDDSPFSAMTLRPYRSLTSSHASGLYVLSFRSGEDESDSNRTLFIKVGASLLEFENLKWAYQILNRRNEHCRVPKPLAFYGRSEGQDILVMEYLPGGTLLYYLLYALLRPSITLLRRRTARIIACCGLCLAELHRNAVQGKTTSLEDEVEMALRKARELPWFDLPELRSLRAGLLQLQRSLPALVPRVKTHYDFSPRNLILGRGHIGLVDWEVIIERSIYYSLAYFFINLESRCRYWGHSLDHILFLQNEFWKSYCCAVGMPLSAEVLRFSKILYVIEYLYDYYFKIGVFERGRSTRAWNNFMCCVTRNYLGPFLVDDAAVAGNIKARHH